MSRSINDVLEARSLDKRSYVLLKQGNFAEAIPLCERIVQLTPNIAIRWARLGWVYSLANRLDEAVNAYDTAISLDSTMPGAWVDKAWDLIRLKRYEEALAAAERACELTATGEQELRKRACVNRSLALLNLGRLADALSAIDEILTFAPNDGEIWLQRGRICVRMQRFHEAEEALLQGIALMPESATGLKELIELYRFHLRDYAKADECCDRLIALHADDGRAWRFKAAILFARKRYQEAASACERAIECGGLDVDSPSWLWNQYACSLIMIGRYGDALRALDQVEELTPSNVVIPANRGETFSRIERYADALALYTAHAEPDDLSLRTNTVEALVHLGRLSEAEVVVQAMLIEQAESDEAWYVKGMLETRREHYDEALEAFKKSLEFEPQYVSALKELTQLLLKLEDTVHACQVIERALALDPYDARAWKVKAQALRAAGRAKEAESAERHGAELLAAQTAQVDAYLQAKREGVDLRAETMRCASQPAQAGFAAEGPLGATSVASPPATPEARP